MPRPTSSTTIQRPDLGQIAYDYMAELSQQRFIGLQVLPIRSVPFQASDYAIITIESMLKMPAKLEREARAAYARSDYEFETGTYSCKERGWEEMVDDKERVMYQRFFDAEVVAARRAVDIIMRAQEKRVANKVMSTTYVPTTSNVGTEWSTLATCTPYADVKTAKAAMRAASGLLPNAIIMAWGVFQNVLACSELRSKLQYTAPIELMPIEAQKNILAQYFGVQKVLVGDALYDSAKKGQSFSLTDIWDDEYILLAVLSEGGDDLKEPCLGRTMLWTADSPTNIVTENYREEQTRSDIYRVRHDVDEAIIFALAGYLLGNITA